MWYFRTSSNILGRSHNWPSLAWHYHEMWEMLSPYFLNFSKLLDTINHHSSFRDIEESAQDGCDMCSLLVWNAHLHQPQIGTYDLDLTHARAAAGSVRLLREEERMRLKIGGNVQENTDNFSSIINFAPEPDDLLCK
jgi:hypothetical protein